MAAALAPMPLVISTSSEPSGASQDFMMRRPLSRPSLPDSEKSAQVPPPFFNATMRRVRSLTAASCRPCPVAQRLSVRHGKEQQINSLPPSHSLWKCTATVIHPIPTGARCFTSTFSHFLFTCCFSPDDPCWSLAHLPVPPIDDLHNHGNQQHVWNDAASISTSIFYVF
jgi:hypothetical protein